MPTFSFVNISDTSVYVYVTPESGYTWHKTYIRTDPATGWEQNDIREFYGSAYVQFTGLQPGTRYAVNVAYGTSGTNWVGWGTAQYFTTTGGSGGGGGGGETGTYSVTLTFNANGGSGAPSAQTYYGSSQYIEVTIPSQVPTRSGYNFLGWATSSSATEAKYFAGQTYTNWWADTSGTYTQALYAVWAKESTGAVRIWNQLEYLKATPYICTNLSTNTWTKATPYVCTNVANNTWQKIT